jgi:hypothetical protein
MTQLLVRDIQAKLMTPSGNDNVIGLYYSSRPHARNDLATST